MSIKATDTRISKFGEYLENILKDLNEKYRKINADFLGIEVNNYSLNKIPVASKIEPYITGGGLYRDVYSFRSRNPYSSDRLNNLRNIGFFEEFESVINSNNEEGILPDIEGIQSIACLNSGTFNYADESMKTAVFDIQLQIVYEEE